MGGTHKKTWIVETSGDKNTCRYTKVLVRRLNTGGCTIRIVWPLLEIFSAVEDFRFSTMDYCTIELISVAKLTQYSSRGMEVIFHMTHRGY